VVNIANSTLFGNSSYDGGGIYIKDSGTVNATNSTIANNSAFANGGGIDNVGGTLTAKSTIIAKNTVGTQGGGNDIFGALTSHGYNFIGEIPNGSIGTTGDQYGSPGFPADPKLGPLQDNGGPTQTCALLSDSTAIDRGNSSGSNIDQRGFVRPVDTPSLPNATDGDGSDIGAYEVQADVLRGCGVINSVVLNNNDGGTDSLRDVIANVCAGSTITFAPNVRHAINLTTAELLVNKAVTINGPGANLLSIQRDASAGNFRVFNIGGNFKVTITGLTIANGHVSFGDFGGGVLNQGGLLTLASCTISGNTADFGGGGISNSGTLNLTNSTVSGNTVRLGGGGISGGTVNITNSTISGNMVTGGNAGGLSVDRVTLTNSTVTGNSASGSGGGVFNNGNNGASVSSTNTIIALNTAPSGPDVSGALTSDGFNLIGNSSGSAITPVRSSDQINVAAGQLKLGPLQNNGGPTFTHALLAGSRAIDKGNNMTGSARDQRGFPRPSEDPHIPNAASGDGSDIGAFEFQVPKPTPTPTGTPKPTPTATATPTPTATPKATATPTAKPTATATPKATATPTAKPTATATPKATATPTAKPTATATPKATATPTAKPTATATPKPTATPPQGRLGNVSTRLQVGTGNNVLFAGFIVQGNASKTLLIRSAGPSLTSFGVPGALSNPQLELHDANSTIGTNDNWQTTQIGGVITSNQVPAIQNSGAAPLDPAEPAIIATLPAGNYTAIVQGVGATQGVATVEVYDLSPNNGAILANISTRGFIQTGDNVMIGGFIVVGQSLKVLIRATGPSLVPFGINNALANPRLELHDANGTLAKNDNWQTTQLGGIIATDQSSAIQNSGLAPTNSAESAIIATLVPGNYTAIVQGVDGGTGIGIVEVFALP
jgi:hypothetical protein